MNSAVRRGSSAYPTRKSVETFRALAIRAAFRRDAVDLQDPTADDAHWEVERAGDWLDKGTELLLQEEPVGVRVRVARMAKEGQSARGDVRSQRATLPTNYVRGLIAKAREKLVKERARW